MSGCYDHERVQRVGCMCLFCTADVRDVIPSFHFISVTGV